MRSAKKTLRGQSALEYLMTYSWALLILLVVMVLIYASGVFNPGRFTPRECVFQPAFQCNSYKLTTGGTEVWMNATNGLGFDIKILSVNVTSTELGVKDAALDLTGSPSPYPYYQNGQSIDFSPALITTAPQKAADNTLVRIDMTIEYANCDSVPGYDGTDAKCDINVATHHVMSGRMVALTEIS